MAISMKNILSWTVALGVGQVIDDAIEATAPANTKPIIKILRKIGAWSLGLIIGEWAYDKTENWYDSIGAKVKLGLEEAKKDISEEDKTNDAEACT